MPISAFIWTNNGEVIEQGQWFKVYLPDNRPLYYLGTSCSAPTVSVLAALNLLTWNCPLPTNPPTNSPSNPWVSPHNPAFKTMRDLVSPGCQGKTGQESNAAGH